MTEPGVKRPKNPRRRGLLKTILGKPYNAKIFNKKVPATNPPDIVPKFSPTAGARNVNKLVPPIQARPAPVDDGSYSVATGGNGKFKKVTYYNKDGKRIAPPKRK